MSLEKKIPGIPEWFLHRIIPNKDAESLLDDFEDYYYEISGVYTGDAYEPSYAESTVKVAASPEIPLYLVFASITGTIASIVAAIGIIAFWYRSTKKKTEKSGEDRN